MMAIDDSSDEDDSSDDSSDEGKGGGGGRGRERERERKYVVRFKIVNPEKPLASPVQLEVQASLQSYFPDDQHAQHPVYPCWYCIGNWHNSVYGSY
jgi:hypothetical protein